MSDIINLVEDWRHHFGLPVRKELQWPDITELELAVKLIYEESEELNVAVLNQDIQEYQDAIGDLFFVLVQAANICGVDLQDVVKRVYDSNMSKLCKTKEEAEKTIESYKNKGVKAYYEEFNNVFIIKRKSDSKVLKGINFFQPKFKTIEG